MDNRDVLLSVQGELCRVNDNLEKLIDVLNQKQPEIRPEKQEECEHKYILESHWAGLLRIRCSVCGDTRDIEDTSKIRKLLSERTFNKRELETASLLMSIANPYTVKEIVGKKKYNELWNKVSKLLKEEEE